MQPRLLDEPDSPIARPYASAWNQSPGESTDPLLWSATGSATPKHVAVMGNFHTVATAPGESWVTVSEEFPGNGWRGDTLLARIRWGRPNRLIPA
jgi:hypothetical protein